ncbi:MAG TPA: hypothetical protein VNC50_13720, partial [Planctomycetia bacterium]|nr:hypothetical protein [Planctomycetia bacterium]
MSDFDPYYLWLGIPAGAGAPPDHFTLLGVSRGEANPKVIRKAQARQSQAVRVEQLAHPKVATRLLNEISHAAGVLLDPEKSAAYLARLDAAKAPPPAAAKSDPLVEEIRREAESAPRAAAAKTAAAAPSNILLRVVLPAAIGLLIVAGFAWAALRDGGAGRADSGADGGTEEPLSDNPLVDSLLALRKEIDAARPAIDSASAEQPVAALTYSSAAELAQKLKARETEWRQSLHSKHVTPIRNRLSSINATIRRRGLDGDTPAGRAYKEAAAELGKLEAAIGVAKWSADAGATLVALQSLERFARDLKGTPRVAEWKAFLKSTDPSLRRMALEALAVAGDPEATSLALAELDALLDKMAPDAAARFCGRLLANPAAVAAVLEALRARPTVAERLPPLALLAAAERDPAGWRAAFPQLRRALSGADALRFFKLEVAARDPDGAK